ncbi:uncharacterized protein B0T23DRAFT_428070 [Neurospora hispaniola]|uniref:Uncharacterized protein n=1 Tax=Neurospora hispaniola TaxID=588809 RepID=A0AAJ0MSU2_9PEZI|nr:hypothetical protein B0T23DRAFT_428070 [Neurospora hispaniola]
MALAVMSMNRDPARWTSVELAEHDVEKEVSESDNHTLGMTVLPLSRTASESAKGQWTSRRLRHRNIFASPIGPGFQGMHQ